MTRRINAFYVEVADDVTGQVSIAELTPGSSWPPPLYAEAKFRSGPGTTETPDEEAPPSGATEEEPQAAAVEPKEQVAAESGSAPPPEPEPTPAEELQPEVEPPQVEEGQELPTFEVDDRADSLKQLVWDPGITEKRRQLHTAPFDGGMWLIMENEGEFPILYRRFGSAKPFGAPTTLTEAKMIALGQSRAWLREDEGDAALNALARAIATEWLAAVGTWVEVKGVRYHFRKGRVRRQLNTLVLCYVHTTHDKKHPRVEFRISWEKTREGLWGQTVSVWVLHYDKTQMADGGIIEKAIDRERFGEFKYLVFGPSPGKKLKWKRVDKYHEVSTYGPYTISLRTSRRGITGLYLEEEGEDDQLLDCGAPEELKARALNKTLRNLRTRTRKRRERQQKSDMARAKDEKEKKARRPSKPREPTSKRPTKRIVVATPVMPGGPQEAPEKKVTKKPEKPPEKTPETSSAEDKAEKPATEKTEKKAEPKMTPIDKIKLSEKADALIKTLAKIRDPSDARYEEALSSEHGLTRNRLYDLGLLEDARVNPGAKSALTKRGFAYLKHHGVEVEDSSDADDGFTEREKQAVAGAVGDSVQRALSRFKPPSQPTA